MGILVTGLTGYMITGIEMLDIRHKKLFNISTGLGIVEMPGLLKLWKSLRDSHNFLENSASFPQSFGKAKKQLFHIPTMLIFIFKFVFLFTQRLVFLFTAVGVKLLTEKLVFLLDFYKKRGRCESAD